MHVNTGHRQKELVYKSRFARVIRDSEDLSGQAQDHEHPSVVACPVAQAMGDPAFNPAVLPARTVTMPLPASVSCPCIRGSVLSCLWRCHPRAPLAHQVPFRCFQATSPPWHCCGAYKVHISRLHVPCVWRRIRRCRPPLYSATASLLPSLLHCRSRRHPSLTCCRGATHQQVTLCLSR